MESRGERHRSSQDRAAIDPAARLVGKHEHFGQKVCSVLATMRYDLWTWLYRRAYDPSFDVERRSANKLELSEMCP